MELDDLLYTYPQRSDPEYQKLLETRLEYSQLKATSKHDIDKIGVYYRHQELLRRHMRNQDRLLVMWEPGTGKTIGSLGSAEQFRVLYNQNRRYNLSYPEIYMNPIHNFIDKCIILVKNKELKNIFRDSILRISDDLNSHLEIKQEGYYNIYTYYEFFQIINEINPRLKYKTDLTDDNTRQSIIEDYGRAFFIIDEAHNINPSVKRRDKDVNDSYNYTHIYNTLRQVFDIAEYSKVMLLTATPIIDKVIEMPYIYNLIIKDENKKLSTNERDYEDPNKNAISLNTPRDVIANKIKGLTSYYRATIPGVEIVEHGDNLRLQQDVSKLKKSDMDYFNRFLSYGVDYTETRHRREDGQITQYEVKFPNKTIIEFPIKVYKSYMQAYQALAYSQLKETSEDKSQPNRQYKTDTKIRNIVFAVGEDEKLVYSNIDNLITQQDEDEFIRRGINGELELTEDFKDNYLADPDDWIHLRNMSSLYYDMLMLVKGHLENKEKKGVIFIYFEFVEWGLELFRLIVQAALGYEKYTYQGGDRPQDKKRRLVVIKSGESNIKKTLDQVSHPDNWNGDYISLVLSSKAGAESYSISHGTTVILAGQFWNMARRRQARARAVRRDGYDTLKRKLGQPIKVDQYYMCSLLETDPQNKVDSKTVDSIHYSYSIFKDMIIQTALQIMEETGFDCSLNLSVNRQPQDKPYSEECHYRQCSTQCYDFRTTVDDQDLYNAIRSGSLIKTKQILNKPSVDPNKDDYKALRLAMSQVNTSMIVLLLNNPKLNLKSDEIFDKLVQYSDMEIVRSLVRFDDFGKTNDKTRIQIIVTAMLH